MPSSAAIHEAPTLRSTDTFVMLYMYTHLELCCYSQASSTLGLQSAIHPESGFKCLIHIRTMVQNWRDVLVPISREAEVHTPWRHPRCGDGKYHNLQTLAVRTQSTILAIVPRIRRFLAMNLSQQRKPLCATHRRYLKECCLRYTITLSWTTDHWEYSEYHLVFLYLQI